MVTLVDLTRRATAGAPLQAHSGAVQAVALSPDGRTLALGDDQGRVTLWDLTSRTRWVLQAAGANSFQFSPDGTILAVASHGGEVRLWEVADRSLVPRRLPADRSDASVVAFTPEAARSPPAARRARSCCGTCAPAAGLVPAGRARQRRWVSVD